MFKQKFFLAAIALASVAPLASQAGGLTYGTVAVPTGDDITGSVLAPATYDITTYHFNDVAGQAFSDAITFSVTAASGSIRSIKIGDSVSLGTGTHLPTVSSIALYQVTGAGPSLVTPVATVTPGLGASTTLSFANLKLGDSYEILVKGFNHATGVAIDTISAGISKGTAVSAVPVPGAAVLLGTGLAGLWGFGRRRRANKTITA